MLFGQRAIAQMASSSFFSEMKSINPAVINGRNYGQYSGRYSADSIKKRQEIVDNGVEVGLAQIDITSMSIFRGGKGGGAFTTEFNFIDSTGKRTETDKAVGIEDTVIKNSAEFTHAEFGLGFFRLLGLSLARQSYKYRSEFEFTTNNINFKEDIKEKITSSIVKIGGIIPLNNLKFSSYIEYGSITRDVNEFKLSSGKNVYSKKETDKAVGIGVAYVTNATHFEVGFEKKLSDKATRATVTGEIRFWKIALGYTGMSYMKGFKDNDQLVYNEIVYPEDSNLTRLEHIFNFSYGASGGFSIGGSGSISKYTTKEKSPFVSELLPPGDVDVETLSYSIKVGYVF